METVMLRTPLLRILILVAPLLVTACQAGHGERCNPSQFADDPAQADCATGYACIYPTAPVCGVAYCCAVDSSGNITDTDPSCQPDATLSCAPDGSVPLVVDMTTVD